MDCRTQGVKRGYDYDDAQLYRPENARKSQRIERFKRGILEVECIEEVVMPPQKRPRLKGFFSEKSPIFSQIVRRSDPYTEIFRARQMARCGPIAVSPVHICRVVRDVVRGAKRAHRFLKGCQKSLAFIRSLRPENR